LCAAHQQHPAIIHHDRLPGRLGIVEVRLTAALTDRRWATIQRFATTPTKPATGYNHPLIVID
jgi:hypothetical protein